MQINRKIFLSDKFVVQMYQLAFRELYVYTN
jgi:hypothetical protein